jgi:hypothetical protein
MLEIAIQKRVKLAANVGKRAAAAATKVAQKKVNSRDAKYL